MWIKKDDKQIDSKFLMMNKQKTLLCDAKKTQLNLCEINNEYPMAKPMFTPRHISGTCDSCQWSSSSSSSAAATKLKTNSSILNEKNIPQRQNADVKVELIELFIENETKIYKKRRSTTSEIDVDHDEGFFIWRIPSVALGTRPHSSNVRFSSLKIVFVSHDE